MGSWKVKADGSVQRWWAKESNLELKTVRQRLACKPIRIGLGDSRVVHHRVADAFTTTGRTSTTTSRLAFATTNGIHNFPLRFKHLTSVSVSKLSLEVQWTIAHHPRLLCDVLS